MQLDYLTDSRRLLIGERISKWILFVSCLPRGYHRLARFNVILIRDSNVCPPWALSARPFALRAPGMRRLVGALVVAVVAQGAAALPRVKVIVCEGSRG